jgi:hypothetical protein
VLLYCCLQPLKDGQHTNARLTDRIVMSHHIKARLTHSIVMSQIHTRCHHPHDVHLGPCTILHSGSHRTARVVHRFKGRASKLAACHTSLRPNTTKKGLSTSCLLYSIFCSRISAAFQSSKALPAPSQAPVVCGVVEGHTKETKTSKSSNRNRVCATFCAEATDLSGCATDYSQSTLAATKP